MPATCSSPPGAWRAALRRRTTLDEYRKYLEKDAALERRFQKVLVNEPSVEDTIAILRGLQERYEVHHGVDITDPAIVAAATLSHRYIADRQLPDKAIDLIDEAAARIRMEIDSKPEALDRLERRIIQLKIEQEALKKEKDDATKSGSPTLQDDAQGLEKEYADLEEIWKSEKASLQGAATIREELEKVKQDMEVARRKGDLTAVARSSTSRFRRSRSAWRRRRSPRPRKPSWSATRSPTRKSPRWFPSGPVFPCPRCSRVRRKNCCAWRRRCRSASSARTRQ